MGIDYKLKSKDITKIGKKEYYIEEFRDTCGIYAIIRDEVSPKAYIGASCDVMTRIKYHFSALKNNSHYNKDLQNDWAQGHIFYKVLVEETTEDMLLETERKYIDMFDKHVLYNKNISTYKREIDYKYLWNERVHPKIKIMVNGCWEPQLSVNKNGYIDISYKNKHYLTHRISYMAHNDDYAELVGHLCNNRKCCNPAHLKSKSHAENARYRAV